MLAQLGQLALMPLRVPVWTAQLATGTKSFERNPVIGSRWLNKHGLHTARVRIAGRIAEMRRRRVAGLVGAADRAAVERDDFVIRANFLPDAEFTELLRQVKTYRGMLREIGEGDTILRKIALDPKTLMALPALGRLLRHPEWRGLIRYIGSRDAEPVVWIQSSLRHAHDGAPDPQTALHADTFGFHARGPSAGRSVRVEIWAYGRRSPFVPWPGFDWWSGAALARRSLLSWRLGDLMERAGVKPHRWRARSGISAFDPA